MSAVMAVMNISALKLANSPLSYGHLRFVHGGYQVPVANENWCKTYPQHSSEIYFSAKQKQLACEL
jgi:hypothetical protein